MTTRRPHRAALPAAPTPMMLALAAAWPLLTHAAPPAVPAKPANSAVPVPSASWRVYGNGGAAPVNTPNAQGGVDQTISQTSSRAIYQWQSFDIGASSSVTFDMAIHGASALNRINASGAPSQIFGRLSATNGGEIFLINPNGILFGQGAVVNTGSLVASALNIKDSEYLSGFAQSLANPANPDLNAAFRYDGAPEDFIDSKNFVRVDPGATLRTENGGRVFLFAKKVENAGTIETPSGQTVLAGGGAIYLKLPGSESALYASETNPAVSAVRGFLVEVGNGPQTAPEGATGSATNLASGLINTPRGNTTLIGMAVNQMGRISATTSVSENGSVILRAQGNASFSGGSGNLVRATESGELVLGEGSRIDIGVDTSTGSDGHAPTSTDSAGFATSHIDMAGHSVTFERGATIVAPGATVNVRAETVPTYDLSGPLAAGDDGARIVMREGSTIDVSGTTGTVESVARNFVTTDLLGSNDLKDAPIQKDGLLYRSRVTVDTREDSPILGSLDAYRANIARAAEERLSSGGTVRLRAEGGVATEAGSRIDVSGGQVRYTEAQVRETTLVSEDGHSYTLNDAPADLVYARATNLLKSSQAVYDRWGVQVSYGSVTPSRTEAGYTEGRAAGTIEIAAPVVALQGTLQAATTQGERQQAGQDARAAGGTLHIGAVVNAGKDFDAAAAPDAVLKNFRVDSVGAALDADFWASPGTAALPAQSAMTLSSLQSGGFQDVAIAANGAVQFGDDASATYRMADNGSLRVLSSDDAVTLAASVRGAHGSVELESKRWDAANPRLGELKSTGAATVADGVQVDLSGAFVNQAIGQLPLDHSATAGGSFVANGYGVSLGSGSVVDVSGGGSVSTAGQFSGSAAGSVSLSDYTLVADATRNTMQLDGALRGYSAASSNGQASGGGSLSLSTHHVRIDAQAQPESTPGLALGASFFDQGGFASFNITGRETLDVGGGAQIAPAVATRMAPQNVALQAGGQAIGGVLTDGLATGLRPASASITLAASGDASDHTLGSLTVDSGAVIAAGDQGTVNLSAAHRLAFDGSIVAHGGNASLAIRGASENESNVLWVGEHAHIDVAGATVLQPGRTDGVLAGQVLAGGNISLNAGTGYASHLVLQEGAVLDARGASGTLDVSLLTDAGLRTQRQVVDSAGGTVSLTSNGGLYAEGQVLLHGGGSAAGGSLSVTLQPADKTDTDALLDPRALQLAAARDHVTGTMTIADLAAPDGVTGTARVGADWLQAAGAGQVRLATSDTLTLADSVDLQVDGTLSLIARGIGAAAGTSSHLGAGQVFIGFSGSDVGRSDTSKLALAPDATAGDATLRIDAAAGMVLDGQLSTQGLGQLTLASGGDFRLQSRDVQLSGRYSAGLKTLADLTLSADQVYAASDTDYSVSAAGRTVRVERNDPTEPLPDKPLSASGGVQIHAADIVQAGVIRAPLGHIVLDATDHLTLAAGSETSVSAAGLTTLYGTATDTTWTRPGSGALTTTPDKKIELDAATLATEAGSSTDVSGGGELVATEFVPGKGGSTDILAGGNGSYALVPSQHSALASGDQSLAAGAAAQGRQIVISKAISLPDGTQLAAGTYTLLPASYAMLPGAFLVRSASTGTRLADGVALAQTDGSVLLGAHLATAGGQTDAGLPQTWQLMSRGTALRYSEIREHTLSATFAERAQHDGTAAPELPNDGGAVVVRAAAATLDGTGRYGAATTADGQALGLGGRLEIASGRIEVDASAQPGDDGVLHLTAASLNQIGDGTLVLGAYSTGVIQGSDGSRAVQLQATAQSVVFAQGDQALTVRDLVAAATDSVDVQAGAHFAPRSGGATNLPADAMQLDGDGAALRVSSQPGAALLRTDVQGAAGQLTVGSGAAFNAGSGSVMLDSASRTHIATDATVAAASIGVASGRISVGDGFADDADTLLLTPALSGQLSAASTLSLRAYDRIELANGASLGRDGATTLVLDTPHLTQDGATGPAGQAATINAGRVVLTNTTGAKADIATASDGALNILATSAHGGDGAIALQGGSMAFDGVTQLHLSADRAVSIDRSATLQAAGDVDIDTPGIVSGGLAAALTLNTAGTLSIGNTHGGTVAASLDGGSFTANAQHIEQAGRIVLPSGQISLNGADGVALAAGSVTDVAGRTTTLDGIAIDQAGGRVELRALSGNATVATGASVDVSGAGGTGAGGTLSVSAAQGSVALGGTVKGTSGADADGARILVDTHTAMDMAALADSLTGQFSGAIDLRQRVGDITVGSAQALRSQTIRLSADGGRVDIQGQLDASGAQGGRIEIAARDDVHLAAGGSLRADAQAESGGAGGQAWLSSTAGRIALDAGSQVSLAARGDAAGGLLTLRAARVGANDVAIGPLAAEFSGVRRIDVQAVKTYDGVSRIDSTGTLPGALSTATIAADNAAFIGNLGENAEAIATRLADGRTAVGDALKVHAEAEVRGNGDLAIQPRQAWSLGLESKDVADRGGASAHVGDSSLTVRAAGELRLEHSLQSGFDALGNRSAQGGSITLVAGADLGAAATTATSANAGIAGSDLRLARKNRSLDLRTTTGDITLVASGDIDMAREKGAHVYTTGGPADAEAANVAQWLEWRPDSRPVFGQLAGRIALDAGRDVLSSSKNIGIQDLVERKDGAIFDGQTFIPVTAFAALAPDGGPKYALMSYGGGDIDVQAGRDAVGVVAATLSSSYLMGDPATAVPRLFQGGSVSVRAGRDVEGGVLAAGGPRIDVQAGRDVVGIGKSGAMAMYYGDTDIRVQARRDVALGNVSSQYFSFDPLAGLGYWLTGFDTQARLTATAAAGSLDFHPTTDAGDESLALLPADVRLAAAHGDLTVGDEVKLLQQPQRDGTLELLAGGALTSTARWQINASRTDDAQHTLLQNERVSAELQVGTNGHASDARWSDGTMLDQGDRSPVRFVAGSGDLDLGGGIVSARPLRAIAGGDLALTGDTMLQVQQQSDTEQSVLRAGRDILFGQGLVRVAGPGEVTLLAGRDIDLGQANQFAYGSGLMAIGNTENTLLPTRSASMTLVAGLQPAAVSGDAGDYARAVACGFELIGSTALAQRAGDVYALVAEGATALGSSTAKTFDTADTGAKLSMLRRLMGDTAYDHALAEYVRGLPGQSALGDTAALSAYATQSEARRDAAPAAMLASLLAQQPAGVRQAFVLQVAGADHVRTAQALQAWMKLRTGEDLSLADAVRAFEALPLERQAGWIDQVLVDELRTQGRVAAAHGGYDAEAAYLRGYQAINTVFVPERTGGDIRLPSTQVKALQPAGAPLLPASGQDAAVQLGGITLLAPGGGVNAGELGSTTQSANNLGVVTVAGGGISGVTRGDFEVNQSRVFSLAQGDILLWSSEGDIDAGRGAKTVSGAPAPVLRLDVSTGKLFLDTSGSFTGSGIAVLDEASALDLYAPSGAIDAGEAGIRARGNVFLGAQVVRGADNLQVGGSVVGAPVAPSSVNPTAGLAATAGALAPPSPTDDEDERKRRRQARRTLLLEFLGYGRG